MKKIFTFILLGSLALSMNAQKQLPNGQFTYWADREVGDITTIEADGWFSPNDITNLVTGGTYDENGVATKVCVTKGTEGDNTFLMIKNYKNTLLPGVIPSAINLGPVSLNMAELTLTFGDALSLAENTQTIKSLTGKYKFKQEGEDIANIAIFGYNKVGEVNDTVMTGVVKIHSTVEDWTTFTIDVKYDNDLAVIPQYVNVVAATIDMYHNDGAVIAINFFGDYSEGTTLSIDDFALTYNTIGINDINNNNEFKIAISNNTLQFIQTPELGNATIKIYSITGQVVYSNNMTSSIDLNNLNNGMYVIQLSNNGKNYTQKFIK